MDGWQLSRSMDAVRILEIATQELSTEFTDNRLYSINTQITEELKLHVSVLLRLFSLSKPLTLPLRPSDTHKLRYVVIDASA